MKKAFNDYRYLAGNTGTQGSLWEGPDHLLYIQAGGLLFAFTETYKRFDYSKIQTISLGRTRTYGWMAALMVLPMIIAAAIFVRLMTRGQGFAGAEIAGGICLGVLLLLTILLIVHLVKGPTCVVKLQTAVQVVRLLPLKRLRVAERVIAHLSQLCIAHQGGEALPANALQSAVKSNAFQQVGVKPPMPRSKFLAFALPLLALAGGLIIGEPFTASLGYFIADVGICLAAHLLVIVSLARLSRFELPSSLRISLWGASANFLLLTVFGYGLLIFGSMSLTAASLHRNAGLAAMESEVNTAILFWLAKAGFAELSGFAWVFVALGGLSLFFALLGLPALFQSSRTAHTEAALPPVMPDAPTIQPAANEMPVETDPS